MARITLGIETSCDETAAALYREGSGIIANQLYSQIESHKKFGGVLPEVASRRQLEKITSIVNEAILESGLTIEDIDVIAVTNKPGLPGSLLAGVCFAKGMAWAAQKKIIGIDHLEAHAFSPLIEHAVPFPHIALTASGGHTALYFIEGLGQYTLIGHTLDDAAGEAFDKIARFMELEYPGGPLIEKLAQQVQYADFFNYTRPMSTELNFSFSGLKTAVLYDLIKRDAYDLKAKKFLKPHDLFFKQQVASSVLCCIKDCIVKKIEQALKLYPHAQAVTFAGGVACNSFIKEHIHGLCKKRGLSFYAPRPAYCTDNAAMIAFVGNYKAAQGKFSDYDLDIFV